MSVTQFVQKMNNNNEGYRFSQEELSALRTLFDSCDVTRSGHIHINQLPGLLKKLGKDEDEIASIIESGTKIAEDQDGQLRFHDIISILERVETATQAPFEGPDPKVIEFLRILEEYRVKCEDEGNYLEAGRAHKQLSVLRKQEEKRQQKAVLARQISERQDVQLAHNMQFSDFNAAWDKYMEEYDSMAQMYIQQMTERHAVMLLEFQKTVRQELASKPPKWSRELLEQRRKQHINARNKNYADAQKLKKVCDKIEEKEKKVMEEEQAIIFARRDAKFRQHQQAELQALLKRIECRRREHIKQRNLDTKRLLQRNRNVQSVLEAKQQFESHRMFENIRKTLQNNGGAANANNNNNNNSGSNRADSPGGRPRSGKQKRSKANYSNNNNNNNSNSGLIEQVVNPSSPQIDHVGYSYEDSGGRRGDSGGGEYSMNGGEDIAFDLPFLQHPGPSLSMDN